MADQFIITPPVVRAEGKDVPPEQIQAGFNSLARQTTVALNTLVGEPEPPSGPAGGDLSGTYPNPTVAAVHATSGTLNGVVVGGVTPAAGHFTTLDATTPVAATSGGTGRNALTANAVVIGEGSSQVNFAAPGAAGGMLISQGAAADPAFANNPVITGGTIDNAPIGGTTKAAGSFTTLTSVVSTETVKVAPGQQIVAFPGVTTDFADAFISQTNAGSHTTTSNSALAISSAVTGSGIDGPSFADYGATISVIKNNFLTSATLGEIDGLTIITRQGQDDTDGILINVGGVNGFMGLIEGVCSQFQATTGTVLKQMDVQVASIETGLTGAPSSIGYLATAAVGTWDAGLQIQSQGSAGYTNAIVVNANNGGGTTFTVTPAGVVNPTGGVVGVPNASSAAAGIIGEFPAPTNLTNVPLTTGTPANVSSVSLTAGDWDVSGVVQFNPAGTTTISTLLSGTSTTSATFQTGEYQALSASFTTGGSQNIAAPVNRISVGVTTTVFLVASAAFGVSTMTANGYLRARRVR